MNKKILIWSLIIIFSIAFTSFVYATDIVMDLNSPVSNTNDSRLPSDTVDNTNSNTAVPNSLASDNVDNTIYSTDNTTEDIDASAGDQLEPEITTTTNYEDSGDLSVTNMINIILIVVGVVLILLGIAIIIRMKS